MMMRLVAWLEAGLQTPVVAAAAGCHPAGHPAGSPTHRSETNQRKRAEAFEV